MATTATRLTGPPPSPVRAYRVVACDRAPALVGMVDDRRRVVRADLAARGLLLRGAHRPRLGEPRKRHAGQLGHPAPDVLAAGVVAALLEHRVVEAAGERRGINA